MELLEGCIKECRIEVQKAEIKWLGLDKGGWNIWEGKLHMGSTFGISDAVDIAELNMSGWKWSVVGDHPKSKLVGKREHIRHWNKLDSYVRCPNVNVF